MNYLSITKPPLEIISSATKAADKAVHDNFISVLARLYRYEIFKPLLDLSASLINENRLRFVVKDKKFYELEEGHCRTTEQSLFNGLRNHFLSKKHYTITINKTSADVIIHEISHMLEQEAEVAPLIGFAETVQSDISISASTNVSLQSAVRQVMIKEVGSYQNAHVNSELFARYFQLMAMTKEVSGYGSEYGYGLQDLYRFFLNTSQWMAQNMYPRVLPKIHESIAHASQAYLKTIDEIQHKWSEERVNSFHNHASDSPSAKPKWSKSIKSIKNPF